MLLRTFAIFSEIMLCRVKVWDVQFIMMLKGQTIIVCGHCFVPASLPTYILWRSTAGVIGRAKVLMQEVVAVVVAFLERWARAY
jgi:hypothetical protein